MNKSLNLPAWQLCCGVSVLPLLFPVADVSAGEDRIEDEIVVIAASPVGEAGVRENQLIAPVQQSTSDDLRNSGARGLADHLRDHLASVSVNEAVSNPWQPDVQYRGFTASPLLGMPQGISVYTNGVRFNEPFGDTVNWDLIPMDAIHSLQLYSGSNPLFGQNTLGGALALSLKNGFNSEGSQLDLGAGQFGYRQLQVQTGGNNGEWGYYLLANREREEGWRQYSDSDVQQLLSVLSWRGDDTDLNLTALLDHNRLIGNGAVPVDLMAIEGRDAVYTHPDQTRNQLGFVALDGEHWLSDSVQLSGNLYLRSNHTRTVNGDDSDYEECDVAGQQSLCTVDDDSGDMDPVSFVGYTDGTTLDDINRLDGSDLDADELDGTLNRSRTTQKSMGLALQVSISEPLADRENLLVVGFSLDRANIRFRSGTEFGVLNNETAADNRGVDGTGLYDAGSEVSLDSRLTNAGLFFSNTLSVNEQLSVTAGGRLNQTRVDMDDQIETGEGSLNGQHKFQRFNPQLGLAYIWNDNLSAYLGYSEASRAPSPAELSCADEDDPCKLPNGFVSDPPLKQVVTHSIETGLRGTEHWFDHSWRWHAGVFRASNRDDILFQQAGGLPSEGYFANVGTTRRVGTELSLRGQIQDVSVGLAYTWMRATFETPFVSFSPNNPLGGNRQVKAGDRMPGLPEHNLKLMADWSLTETVSVGGDVQYRSSQYFRGDEANENRPLAGYALLNTHAAWQVTTALEIRAGIHNLLDREYGTFGMYGQSSEVLGDIYSGFDDVRYVSPGAPRTVQVGASLKF
jgi:iron complex outermembrane recepter protein